MDMLCQAAVPLIVTIVYGMLAVYKCVVDGKDKLIKIIPFIAYTLGAALGVVAFYSVPELLPAKNVLMALLIGGCSGLASTGTHQAFKIFSKNTDGTDYNKDEIINNTTKENSEDSTKDDFKF